MKINWIVSNIENKLKNAILTDNIRNQVIYSRMLSDLSYASSSERERISREDFIEKLNQFDLSYFYNSFFNIISFLYEKIIDKDYSFECETDEKRESEELIKLCRDFYKKNDKDSFNMFKRIIRNDNIFEFLNNRDLPFMGRTYYINQEEYYVLVNGRNYFEDTLSIIHETKHIDMYIRGYNNGLTIYNELAPILYEMYMIDYLSQMENTGNLKITNINKYIQLIRKLGFQMSLIKELKSTRLPNEAFQYLYNNYDRLYDEYDLENVYKVLNVGYSKKTIGSIISFIVALDVYLNCKINNVNNVLSLYLFGKYKFQPSILNGILEYIDELYKPYKNSKVKKK